MWERNGTYKVKQNIRWNSTDLHWQPYSKRGHGKLALPVGTTLTLAVCPDPLIFRQGEQSYIFPPEDAKQFLVCFDGL